MQRLEVSGAIRPIYGSLGVHSYIKIITYYTSYVFNNKAFDKTLIKTHHN